MQSPVKSDPITVRAAALLPAGGAFDAKAIAIPLGDYSEILIRILYTQDAAAAGVGTPIMFPLVSDAEFGTYYPLPLDNNTLTVSSPSAYTTIYQLERLFGPPSGAGVTAMSASFSVPTSKWMKIFFAEKGDPVHPGVLQADCVLGGRQLA